MIPGLGLTPGPDQDPDAMTPITVFVSIVVAALILHDWRKALPVLFLIGVLQDVPAIPAKLK